MVSEPPRCVGQRTERAQQGIALPPVIPTLAHVICPQSDDLPRLAPYRVGAYLPPQNRA
jgi:hypothetical protein